MATSKKRSRARDELLLVIVILISILAGWYVFLYKPVNAKTVAFKQDIKADQDSLAAIVRYKEMQAALSEYVEQLNEEIENWDAKFPPRSSLVTIAKQILFFCQNNGIKLVAMQPSLFELYALERAGNTIAGRYIYKQLFTLKLRGQYRNFGRMLERMQSLPFKVTVSDISMTIVEGSRPVLDIDLNMFIYVHR